MFKLIGSLVIVAAIIALVSGSTTKSHANNVPNSFRAMVHWGKFYGQTFQLYSPPIDHRVSALDVKSDWTRQTRVVGLSHSYTGYRNNRPPTFQIEAQTDNLTHLMDGEFESSNRIVDLFVTLDGRKYPSFTEADIHFEYRAFDCHPAGPQLEVAFVGAQTTVTGDQHNHRDDRGQQRRPTVSGYLRGDLASQRNSQLCRPTQWWPPDQPTMG